MSLVDWLLRRRQDNDLQEEIRTHLAMAVRDRAESGASPSAARAAALKEFGNVTLIREATVRSWRGGWRESVANAVRDVRYAVRVLGRSPAYALVVIAVLALGIGANVAVFSLFKSLALKPLPGVDRSASLAVVVARTTAGRIVPLSHPDFRDLQRDTQAFQRLAGTASSSFTLGLGANSRRVQGELVTGNYFQVLGVDADRGRSLLPSDDVSPGTSPVVVISDHLWKRTFASDPAIVGRTIHVNAVPLTVVGVASADFHGTIVSWVVDLFIPMMMQPQIQAEDSLSARQTPLLWGLGRLKPSIALTAADQEAQLLSKRIDAAQPDRAVDQRATVIPLWQSPFGAQTYFLPLVAMLGAMGALLLLIVCANVSNLALVRGLSRRAEIAARLALGASRGRILRLLLVESLVLSLPGTVLGLFAARALLKVIDLNNLGDVLPITIFLDTSADWTVIAFAALLAIGSAFAFALVPALRSSRLDLAKVMKDDLSPRGGSRGRLRGALVVAQVAVSLLLLVCAGLVLRSLQAAQTADAGFDAKNVVVLGLNVQPNGYDKGSGRAFYRQLLDAARADSGIESATLASEVPLQFVDNETSEMAIDGRAPRDGEDMQVQTNTIAPDYFRTLRIPLVVGRDFAASDREGSQPVVIVNETMARRFWGTPEQALGKRLRVAIRSAGTEPSDRPWRSVVGVARDIKYARLTESPRPYLYVPFEQAYQPGIGLYVRARDASRAVSHSRALVASLDVALPTHGARMLTVVTDLALTIFNMAARVLMTFGLVGLVLTALGTYGLVSYAARQSTHEIGVRLAIGARRLHVVRQFLRRGVVLGVMGTACGLVAAVALTRLLASQLYGVSAMDAMSFTFASGAVLVIVVVASLIPAWRASCTDPIVALRQR